MLPYAHMTRTQTQSGSPSKIVGISVIVAALGYFVDIYDLVLFSIVRVPSLRALGITDPAALLDVGAQLLNMQMFGMLLGGVIWGILGDKKGPVVRAVRVDCPLLDCKHCERIRQFGARPTPGCG